MKIIQTFIKFEEGNPYGITIFKDNNYKNFYTFLNEKKN